jgi:hypothetical protein
LLRGVFIRLDSLQDVGRGGREEIVLAGGFVEPLSNTMLLDVSRNLGELRSADLGGAAAHPVGVEPSVFVCILVVERSSQQV